MKELTVEEFAKEAVTALDMAQHDRVVVTRNGKPFAVLLGIENKDEEDLAFERDESFWQMIHARRKERTISLATVKKQFGLDQNTGAKRK